MEKDNSVDQLSLDEYTFEPIKGYPVLNWQGKSPFTATQFFPAQLKESYGEPSDWMDRIYWGDNLQVMSHLLKEFRSKIQLVYIDPPFDSKANYKKRIKIKGKKVENDYHTFEEKQYSDIWAEDSYLQFMYERIILIRELLTPTGLFVLHCDPNQGHYLKCMADEIFGRESFVNQVIWKRSDAHNDSGQGAKHLGTIHDMLFIYRKTSDYKWNQIYLPLPQKTIDNWYRNIEEETGRKYNKADVTGPGGKAKGNPVYEWNGVTRAWRYSKEKMKQLHDEGRLVYSSSGMPYQKRYLDESKGISLQDWWDDIQMVRGIQRRGKAQYPTEKPIDLLKRIIELTTDENDIVFDGFSGSGTTLHAARELKRKFIGGDINQAAVEMTIKRLLENKISGFEYFTVNNYDFFRNPDEAKDILVDFFEMNKIKGTIFDAEKDGYKVKVMPVNRIATKADLRELIASLDYKDLKKKEDGAGSKPVEKIKLICMGHEPDLAAYFEKEVPFKIEVKVVDVLKENNNLTFKKEPEAKLEIKGSKLRVIKFYPMNLLQKLSLQKSKVDNWKELVESISIDWNYDGSVFEPKVIDYPDDKDFVIGEYNIPEDASTARIKITDLLSEVYVEDISLG